MKKSLILGALMALFFVQCGKDSDQFLIKKGEIGNLTDRTKMKELDSIFTEDSIVKMNSSPNALEIQGEVEIYEKGGQKLVLLSPENENDPNATITDIMVFDPRYKTEKGLSVSSTFKEFRDNYTVSHIERIINGVLVFFSDTDIYLTIESKYLPEEIQNNPDASIDVSNIADTAPIKYFRIGWESEVK